MTSRFERFTLAISEVYRHWHKIASDEMEPYGLKGPHALYLVAIYRYEDGVTAAQLAEICRRNKADVSRAVSAMEKQGILTREGNGDNLYRARLKLTEKGRVAAEQVRHRARIAAELGGKDMSDERRVAFYEDLETIAENLRTMSDQGMPRERGENV